MDNNSKENGKYAGRYYYNYKDSYYERRYKDSNFEHTRPVKVLDNGYNHEVKISKMGLACPKYSGFNHLVVFLRWAYEKNMLKESLFGNEPLLKPALEGNGDLREVLANSPFMKGKIYSNYFTDECRDFAETFYDFGSDGSYPGCVDDNALAYFGEEKYHCEEFQDEAYLFVPYGEDYYKSLSKYIEDAWAKRQA